MKPIFTVVLLLAFCLPTLSCRNPNSSKSAALAVPVPAPGFRVVPNGVELKTGDLNVKAQFYSDDIVRVLKWTDSGTSNKASLVVVQKELHDLNIRLREDTDSVILTSARLVVRISRRDGAMEFRTSDDRLQLMERGRAELKPVQMPYETNAFSVEQDFVLSPQEGIYGLGQHQSGYMNYRGKTVKLVQANTEAVSPFLISTAGYGILWDNYSKTIFSDAADHASFWSDVGDNVDYYFVSGTDMDGVISGYRDLTGRAPMYGKWAYGYWQSKEHYHTRDELMFVAQEYRKREIPIDNLIQDWNYWAGIRNWSSMEFDETRYPNPKQMVDELHGMNYHLMISVWAGLGPDSAIYKEMDRNGFLYPPFGWAGFKYYDAFNPQANQIWWKYLRDGLFSKGIDGWWLDSTEPDVINALTKEGQEYEMKRIGTNYLGSWARYLNPFSLEMIDGLYSNLRKESDRKRVYILTRSTFAGQQRDAATTWSGDIGANWDVFRHQIAGGINHSMAGIPYWTFDIGAFVIGAYDGVFSNGGKDPAYQELYTRMFQFGAFCPIFRAHGSETPREIWEFGDFSPVLVKFDNLRYRLLPYIYSLAWRVTDQGYSILRGLPMDFAGDTITYDVNDQFMFGPALMVCPVTAYQLHRPPEDSVLISAEHFKTKDGRPRLAATYYKDSEFKTVCHQQVETNINLFWYTGWPDFITGPQFSVRWEGKLTPDQTGTHRFHMKSFGPKRIFIDGKELTNNYTSVEAYTVPVELEAGREYDFACETANSTLGAFRAQLFWKTPEIYKREQSTEPRQTTRQVYLPARTRWVDFWTGQGMDGGASIAADAPIDKLPILVRAGSIVPMGPFVQYATEKPADPIELRVYPGADGEFVLYEDENDNYDYEKGAHATIAFHWDDDRKELTIGARQGSFPGMLNQRHFEVVIVAANHGVGVETTEKPDKVVAYDGTTQTVRF